MNRDQYFDRHRNLNIEREILERKWRAYQEEQQLMEQMRIFEAARAASSASAAAAGAGGGYLPQPVDTNPRAIKIAAKNNMIGYYDGANTGNLVFFTADWDSVSFSDNADTGIPYSDIDGWYFDEMIDGKGVLARITMNNNDRYYIFIDAGGNIIEKVHLIYGSTYGTSANRRSSEGLVIQLSYRNDSGRIIKWWNGDEIFTHTDTTINSNSNNFSLDYYGYDDAFSDGTTSASIIDEDLGYRRIFHCRPNGQFLEVTSSLRINGIQSQNESLHCIGNFAISTFQFDTPNLDGTASYDNGSFDVTLSAPVTGLRRGMEITGGDFDPGTLVTSISNDGLTITVSILPNLTNNDAPVIFIGNFLDTIRVTLADGTVHRDFDVSEYDAKFDILFELFGSDKAVLVLSRVFDSKVVYVIYSHTTGVLSTTTPINYLDYNQISNSDLKQTFYSSVNSVAGCERFLGAQLGNQTWDGKMYRYEDFTFIWSNSSGRVFTYTFDTSVETVGYNNTGYGYGSPMYAVINSPGSTDLEIMRFNDNGTVNITSLGTAYGYWNDYLEYGALGDNTYVSWKDSSRVLPDNKIQAFAVFAGGTGPVDQIWVTQNNNGAQIGKTQFIGQGDEGVTYLFNYGLNEYYTISDLVVGWTEFRYDSYQNAINFEMLSNAALYPGDGSFYLVNPSYTPPVKLEDGEPEEFRGSSDYAVKLSIDGGPEGFIRINVYDYEGTLVNFVITQATTYENFDVVNERIFLSQNPTGDTWHYYIITPNEDEYVFKEITTDGGLDYLFNSWGWWD